MTHDGCVIVVVVVAGAKAANRRNPCMLLALFTNKMEKGGELINEALVSEVLDWCITHGIVMAQRNPCDGRICLAHLPVTLIPSPFPKAAYRFAMDLAPAFNTLIHRISKDLPYLIEKLAETIKTDEYTAKLVDIAKDVYINASRAPYPGLGLLRSDYMLDQKENSNTRLYQVEINTISSAYGCMSDRVRELHRHILSQPHSKPPGMSTDSLPESPSSTEALATGLFEASQLHYKLYPGRNGKQTEERICIFIILDGELNTCDQRHLEYELLKKGVKSLRASLRTIYNEAKLHETSVNELPTLWFRDNPVSVIYFRAGYSPDHYQDEEWQARILIEKSNAVKSPTIPYQLAGTKKIQQELAKPGELEKFFPLEEEQHIVDLIKRSFTGLYPVEDEKMRRVAIENPHNFVLKPQREGGGNNFYGENLKTKLEHITQEEMPAFILMERIFPAPYNTIMMKGGIATHEVAVSELGIFSAVLSGGDGEEALNLAGGSLLRTKVFGSDEGGVSAGYAVVDSVYLKN